MYKRYITEGTTAVTRKMLVCQFACTVQGGFYLFFIITDVPPWISLLVLIMKISLMAMSVLITVKGSKETKLCSALLHCYTCFHQQPTDHLVNSLFLSLFLSNFLSCYNASALSLHFNFCANNLFSLGHQSETKSSATLHYTHFCVL